MESSKTIGAVPGFVLGLLITISLFLGAEETVSVLGHSRFYRGERQIGATSGVRVSTRALDDLPQTEDDYLGSGVRESSRIREIYGLAGIFLVNQGSWRWRAGKPSVLMKVFGQPGDRVSVRIRNKGEDHFQLEIFEGEPGGPDGKPYLMVSFVLPAARTTVFGFEDGQGAPCFFSFHHCPPKENGARGEPSEAVFPQYPPQALRDGTEGAVALLAPLGQDGRVDGARLRVHAGPPVLVPCAREAFLHTRWMPGGGGEKERDRPGHVALVVLFTLQEPGGDALAPADAYRRSQDFARLKEVMKAMGTGPWLLKMILVTGHKGG